MPIDRGPSTPRRSPRRLPPRCGRRPPGPAASVTLGSLATLKLLIVDDAQELTRSTLALLRRFAERGVAIVAVGDPDVSTGSFRGSHPDALGRLAQHLALDSVDTIVSRHGSSARIRHPRHRRCSVGPHRNGGHHRATPPSQCRRMPLSVPWTPLPVPAASPPCVRARIAGSPAQQLELIARSLRERHVFDGVAWGEMAVIVRSGSLGAAVAGAGVPRSADGRLDGPIERCATTPRCVPSARPRRGPGASTARRPRGHRTAARAARRARSHRPPTAAYRTPPGGARRRTGRAAQTTSSSRRCDIRPASTPSIPDGPSRDPARPRACVQASAEAAAGATIEELLWGLWQRSGLERHWHEQSKDVGHRRRRGQPPPRRRRGVVPRPQRFVERSPWRPRAVPRRMLAAELAEDTLAPRAVADVGHGRDADGDDRARVRGRGRRRGAGERLAQPANSRVAARLQRARRRGAGASADTDRRATAVLHDELRLFAQAVSRSRTEVVVTAVKRRGPGAVAILLAAPRARRHASTSGIRSRCADSSPGCAAP